MAKRSRSVRRRSEQTRQLVSHYHPKSTIAEQYRTIRTNIQFLSDDTMQSIIVTSAEPSEGKSTTAANVATVMAQQGKRVLLVDADLRKPTCHFMFHVSNAFGFSTVLSGQREAEDIIVETMVPNLFLLPSGPIPPNPSELLGSQRMQQVLSTFTSQYDYVFFDTPPILAVADAHVLANLCDGSIFVIRSGKADRNQLLKAKELLAKSQATLLGAVLNGKEKKEHEYYYYG